MKIFVPGRLCLFGEHTDWAGGYRHQNPNLATGLALVIGTDCGIYAEVKTHRDRLILHTSDRQLYQLPFKKSSLLTAALKKSFLSYIAGVAYQALTYYQVGGLEINNYLTDLPIEKGLSSSAAICVLVARAFNLLYDLKLTLRGEMELAYLGERTTSSQCGRLDQICAYGDRPVLATFDRNFLEIEELSLTQDLFLLIIDLGARKNTQLILDRLNECYPFATNKIQQNVQQYLGEISSQITREAAVAIQQGDAAKIGYLMTQAQTEFDRYLIPACPSELTAPILHKVLNYPAIQPYIYGGKGVGSQGDGTAQLIVKNRDCQQKVKEIIARDFPQMQCFSLTIKKCRTSIY